MKYFAPLAFHPNNQPRDRAPICIRNLSQKIIQELGNPGNTLGPQKLLNGSIAFPGLAAHQIPLKSGQLFRGKESFSMEQLGACLEVIIIIIETLARVKVNIFDVDASLEGRLGNIPGEGGLFVNLNLGAVGACYHRHLCFGSGYGMKAQHNRCIV